MHPLQQPEAPFGRVPVGCGSDGAVVVSQSDALAETVEALSLRPEHRALVAYCEGLAAALDDYPERATLWREYRPAIELLLAVGEASEDDGEAALLKLVSTPVRHAKKAG